MKFSLRIENVCAIGLIIGFFLPWVDIGGFIAISGYQIPKIINGIGQFRKMAGQETDGVTLVYILLYLIPILSVVTIIANIYDKNPKIPALFAGIIPIVGLFYLIIKADISENKATDIFQIISIGTYVTLVSAIGMIMSVMGILTLPRNMTDISMGQFFSELKFDSKKWNALVKYDRDIALVVDRLLPFGQKWVDEFASSYLVLNDKQYISEIEEKILAAAKEEAMREEQRIAAIEKEALKEKQRIAAILKEKEEENERIKNLSKEQENTRSAYGQERIVANNNIPVIVGILSLIVIVTVVGIVLWQKNLSIEEEKSRIANERNKIEEERLKNEELQQQLSDERDRIANEKIKIREQQKLSAMESAIVNEPTQKENYRPQPLNNPRSNVISVSSPDIQIGDSYIYESFDPDDQKSRFTTKRTIISVGTDIVFSSINLASKKAKPRSLRFNREWNLISARNAESGGFDYSPPLKYYDFPLSPGKTWEQVTTETDIKTGKIRIHTITGTVGQWEDVTVPAGTFHAIRVNLGTNVFNPSTGEQINGTDTSWYVPEVHRSVKSITTGKDGKRQIIQLLQYELK